MDAQSSFGGRIKRARESKGFTVEYAAEECGVSVSSWKQYENGGRLPGLDNFKKICVLLRVLPGYLLGPELDGILEELDWVEQLKGKIDMLHSDDISVIDAAVSKRLEILNGK